MKPTKKSKDGYDLMYPDVDGLPYEEPRTWYQKEELPSEEPEETDDKRAKTEN